MEDSNIIELYFSRCEHAIAATSEKYGNYLGYISMNILHNREDAAECVNDTYLHTWNAIPPKRPSAFRAWLGTITRNLSFDRYKHANAKKRGGTEMELILSELGECIPSSANVERTVEDKEIARLINCFLRNQKPENCMIFVRRYWYGDSIAKISERFLISDSKIKSSLFRTRKLLRLHLEREGVIL